MCSYLRAIVWYEKYLLYAIYLSHILMLYSSLETYPEADFVGSIASGNIISNSNKGTLVSSGRKFQLGFFSPKGGSDSGSYLGIWYYMSSPKVVVWVANNGKPLEGSGYFGISDDGNLVVFDYISSSRCFSSSLAPLSSKRTAILFDFGNLVLRDDSSGKILWESFSHPTDTFLPGMKMDVVETLKLTSWKSRDNPAPGSYVFELDDQGSPIIQNGSSTHWESADSSKFTDSQLPFTVAFLFSNFTNLPKAQKNVSRSLTISDYIDTRLVLSSSGQIQWWNMSLLIKNYSDLIWSAPVDQCSIYKFCGNYGSCNNKNTVKCKCLPGFEAIVSEDQIMSGDFSSGCNRKSPICTEDDIFLNFQRMKVSDPDPNFNGTGLSAEDCENECRASCHCLAYSFVENSQRGRGEQRCWIWNSDLYNLEEDYGTHDLYVRVAASDIKSTSRQCETCGTTIVPYPLSTGPNCGDPDYDHFICIDSDLSFYRQGSAYRVSTIFTDTQRFVIQVGSAYSCKNSTPKVLELDTSLPFNVTNPCYVDPAISSSSDSLDLSNEIEISWYPPSEPVCTLNSSSSCRDWPNSSCSTTKDGQQRCLCNKNYNWNGMTLNCAEVSFNHGKSESNSARRKSALVTAGVITAVLIAVSLLGTLVYYFYKRRLETARRGSRESQSNQAMHLYNVEKRAKNFIDSCDFKEDEKKGIDVPFFELETILEATGYFSDANKLGEGGFGPVYKGIFYGEREMAVKRLSINSRQGLEEFKNEVILIAKLQHHNLVRLLGYCIQGEEKILLYEYMPNKSLDAFIFDRGLSMLLDWDKRFDIILGIARGLLYLHQDSRLRVIHRDLKTSNILLDEEMNPKISDFGLARIVEGNETKANTTRVVGTYGYMSPEYALEGLFSTKSDVFSFGVILLEIVSGKRNTGFFQSELALSLLGYAWRLWGEEKILDLMDQTLSLSNKSDEVMRCITVGLLCVQEDPSDRPNMSDALFLLSSETATLPNPKQPAFVTKKWVASSSSSVTESCSNAGLTISSALGR